jgi:hypothetical protein
MNSSHAPPLFLHPGMHQAEEQGDTTCLQTAAGGDAELVRLARTLQLHMRFTCLH